MGRFHHHFSWTIFLLTTATFLSDVGKLPAPGSSGHICLQNSNGSKTPVTTDPNLHPQRSLLTSLLARPQLPISKTHHCGVRTDRRTNRTE
ncbi:hypothetical protein LEMLEM_LOCUS9425 [Lemmus lemmus]